MSERVFYPDMDDVSSTSKVVALSIAFAIERVN